MNSVIFLACILSASAGLAQTSNNSYVTNSVFSFDNVTMKENISSAALRSFNKMFNNVENARWNVIDDGCTVKFKQNNVSYHVFYNKRGKWQATMECLPLEVLPRWVTGRVKSEYKKFSIFFAQRVKTAAGQTYIIKIEKGNDWKCLCISREATEVMGEYVRN